MGRSGKKKREARPDVSRGGFAQALMRFLRTLLALLLIGYATLLAASRTPGFAVLAERRLSRKSGRTWHVDAARITPALRLYLRNVRTAPEDEAPSVRIGEMVLYPGHYFAPYVRGLPRTLHVRNVKAVWAESDSDAADSFFTVWSERLRPGGAGIPAFFLEPAGSTPRTRAPAPWPPYRITVENADMEWRDSQGALRSAARGVHVQATPWAPAGRRFTHLRLYAREWCVGPNTVHTHVEAEWLDREGLRWILDVTEGGAQSESPFLPQSQSR